MSDKAFIGDSVRLKAKYQSFDGLYADPTNITLKIYTSARVQIGETIGITTTHKTSTGHYQYDYTIPSGYTSIVYEFSGTLDGTVVTARKTINIIWTA